MGKSRRDLTYGWNTYALRLRFRDHAKTFAHGFLAVDHNTVSIVYHPVADCIGNQGISDLVAPSRNVELGAQDGRSLLVARISYLQKITSLAFLQRKPRSQMLATPKCIAEMNLSDNFYGWVFAFGGSMKVTSPVWARDEFHSVVTTHVQL